MSCEVMYATFPHHHPYFGHPSSGSSYSSPSRASASSAPSSGSSASSNYHYPPANITLVSEQPDRGHGNGHGHMQTTAVASPSPVQQRANSGAADSPYHQHADHQGYKISEHDVTTSSPSNPRRHPGSLEASPVTSPLGNPSDAQKDFELRLADNKGEDLSPRQTSNPSGPPHARYLSSNCVVYTFYSGETKNIVDEHFSRALGDQRQRRYDDEESKENMPMSRRSFPPSFWNSNYQPPPTMAAMAAAMMPGTSGYHPGMSSDYYGNAAVDPYASHHHHQMAMQHGHHSAFHQQAQAGDPWNFSLNPAAAAAAYQQHRSMQELAYSAASMGANSRFGHGQYSSLFLPAAAAKMSHRLGTESVSPAAAEPAATILTSAADSAALRSPEAHSVPSTSSAYLATHHVDPNSVATDLTTAHAQVQAHAAAAAAFHHHHPYHPAPHHQQLPDVNYGAVAHTPHHYAAHPHAIAGFGPENGVQPEATKEMYWF